MTRVFVALTLPDGIKRAIARTVEPLRRDGSVRWVDPDLLHVTLRFFGDVDDDVLVRIQELTGQVALLHAPFKAEVSVAGTFPPKGRPKVFWAGLGRGAREATELATMLDRAFEGAGLGASDRPFRPHVTVGRAKPMRGRGAPVRAGRPDFRRLTFQTPLFTFGDVSVVASELSPRGPSYTPLAEFLLTG